VVTAALRVTQIIRTGVTIPTAEFIIAGEAHPTTALVTERTHVAVVAGVLGRQMDTPECFIAQVFGAGIAVFAFQGSRSSLAFAAHALIAGVAQVVVDTWFGIELVATPCGRHANICSAAVFVVAIEFVRPGGADAAHTEISHGARITIVAFRIGRIVLTSSPGIAGVCGARIVIVAIRGNTCALPSLASVVLSARVTIVTRRGNRAEQTAGGWLATVCRARIRIVASQPVGTRLALTTLAEVLDGAHILVGAVVAVTVGPVLRVCGRHALLARVYRVDIARKATHPVDKTVAGQDLVAAPPFLHAGIRRALHSVIAGEQFSLTRPVQARVLHCARVAVVAGLAVFPTDRQFRLLR